MQSDLIIRVVYEGTVYDLDVINEVPLRVDMSTVEAGELGRIFGIGSQTFTLPGTKKNNRFFKNAYDIAADNPPGMYNSIDGYVIQNGETLLQGQFQLNEVVTDEDGFVNYNVQISDRVIQFKEALEGKYLADADWSAFTHTLTSGSIVDSWSGNLLGGKVFYPLAEYGRPDNEQGSSPYPYLGFYQGYLMGTQLRPIQVEQFLPAVKVKDALTVIFNQVNFSYTGSFMEKQEIDNLYMLTKANDDFGPVVPSASATFTAQGTSINELVFLGTTNGKVPVTVESFDPQNAYDTTISEYTAQASGDHTFNGSITFYNPITSGGDSARVKLDLAVGSYGVATTIVESSQIDLTSTSGTGPFTLSVAGTRSLTTSVDDAWLQISYTSLSGTPLSLVLLGDEGRQFRCTSAPTTYKGATIDMADQFNNELKSSDVIQALITQFNLVMVPDQNNPAVIQIETFDDWIRSGEYVDWTEKYDTSQRVSVTHTINDLPKKVILSQAEDNDRLSKITKEQEPYRQYGSLELFATSNNAIGEDKLETLFAPTILGGVYDASSLGSSSYDINLNATTVYPHLYKYENDKILPYGFKPRLGFRVNNNLPSGSLIHIGDASGGGTYTGLTISGSYGTLSNLSQLPAVPGSTIDLHFNNTYTDFGSTALNFDSAVDSFNRYWKTYYDSLYWDDAKKITLSIKFNPQEYKNIKLNDRILIKNQYYRINKIKGFNVSYRDVVEVELIRLYPSYFQFGTPPVPSPSPTSSPLPTPSSTGTPTPTPSSGSGEVTPTPTPSPSSSPVTPTPTPSSTSTPTPSPTTGGVTPTPTPTEVVWFAHDLGYDVDVPNEACIGTQTTYYSECILLGTGCYLYNTQNLSDPVFNGIYSDGTDTYTVTFQGEITSTGTCPAPTPTPSIGPSCDPIQLNGTWLSSATACGADTEPTTTYYTSGTTSVQTGDVIYNGNTCLSGDEVDDGWYWASTADSAIRTVSGEIVEIVDCTAVPSPTPTPTNTPTPTPAVWFAHSLGYDVDVANEACLASQSTYYSECTLLSTGCVLYNSQNLSDPVFNGIYSDGSNTYTVTFQGEITSTGTCPTPPATPTPTPTPTTSPIPPVYSYSLRYSNISEADACNNSAVNYDGDSPSFDTTTVLYDFGTTNNAAAGYYLLSDNTTWRYWNGSSFTSSGSNPCGGGPV